MEMRRLRVFCKVVELKSFTKAGESLKLSQPTVSEHVRALEDSLREKLVDRLGREALPTPAGRILYQYARNIIQMNDEAEQALEQFRGNLAGRLVLGASTIPGTYLLPRLIGAFKALHAAIQITLKISDTGEIAAQVMEGGLEAGIVGSSWSDRRLLSEEICSDELILVVPPEHRWAGLNGIKPNSMMDEPFILRESGSGTRMAMNRILEEHGFDPSRLSAIAEMGSTEAVRQGIKARIGISILSREAVAEDIELGTLVHVPIKDVRFVRPLYLVQRKNRQMSPVCTAFLEHVRSSAPPK